jgi:hypothetical protein
MNPSRKILNMLIAVAGVAIGTTLPAAASDSFLAELARTDGNPQGERTVLAQSPEKSSTLSKQTAAFLRELARTDGNPQGEWAATEQSRAKASTRSKDRVAFLGELARTDGNPVGEPAPIPSRGRNGLSWIGGVCDGSD